MHLEAFIELIRRLFSNYLTFGWPFAAVHGILIVIYLMRLWRIRQELEELRTWNPASDVPKSEPCRILHSFHNDCQEAGRHGVLVPMTDYSDRLSSLVDHRVAHLHSLANFFLVIGVMGTFFAVFQFASSVRAGLAPEQIGRSLSDGLASAFPIGFMGLLFSIVFHYCALVTESGFRTKVDEAIERAVQERPKTLKTEVTVIESALKPLLDLRLTLSETLAPVIEDFRIQLERVQSEMAGQVQPMADAAEKLVECVVGLDETVLALDRSAEEHAKLLERTAQIQKDNLSAAKRSRELFEGMDRLILASSDRLLQAAERFATMPGLMQDSISREIDIMTTKLSGTLSETMAESMRRLEETASAIADGAGQLQRATEAFAELPASWTKEVEKSLMNLSDGCQANAQEINEIVRAAHESIAANVLATWQDSLGAVSDRLAQAHHDHLQQLHKTVEEACLSLKDASNNAATAFASVKREATDFFREAVATAEEELKPHLHRVRNMILDDYPKILKNLKEAADYAGDMAGKVEQMQASYDSILESLNQASEILLNTTQQLEATAASMPGARIDFGPLKDAMTHLPVQIAKALNASQKNGPPVLLVKALPMWRRI